MKKHHSQIVRTAYHEAGHAAMSSIHDKEIYTATIVPGEDYVGQVQSATFTPGEDYAGQVYFEGTHKDIELDWDLEVRAEFEKLIMISMAGEAAECILMARKNRAANWRGRSSGDSSTIVHLLGRLTQGGIESFHYARLLWGWTVGELKNPLHWFLVDRIANQLLEIKTLSGDEIAAIHAAAVKVPIERKLKWEIGWKENLAI